MHTFFEGGPWMKHRGGRRFWGRMGREAPFFGGFWSESGKERRMRRGDVKYVILRALLNRPMHGYDVMQALEEQYQGRYRPSPGSVYPTLQMLEDGGFVTSQVVEGKRVYEITDAGKRLLEERGNVDEDDDEPGISDIHELHRVAHSLINALRQGVMQGDPEVRERIRKILDDARREIYTILAESE